MKTFYVTTKAIGPKGIVTVEAEPCEEIDGLDEPTGLVYIVVGGNELIVGSDAFESLDDARYNAIERARKKIKSIVKAEAKLEAKIAKWDSELPQ